tara:strand:+ start:1111 stop:1461 length:351 start_codon:yes stop_codon:yes gene_type:complete
MYEYNAKCTRVVDGDTIDCDIDLGFGIVLHKQRVRLSGINTPEIRTKDLNEKQRGLKAKQRVIEILNSIDNSFILRTTEYNSTGKYGRILGIIVIESSLVSLNDMLIEEGHAEVYG